MATGLIYGTTNHPSGQLEVRISYWQNNINVGANTSQVGADLYARRKDGYETWGSWSGRVNVGGSWSQTITRQVTVGASWVHLGSYSRTLTHNDDGSRPVYFSADGGISGAGWTTTSIGQTIQMDSIPRRSVPTLSTSTPEVGTAFTVYTNRKSSTFTHNLRAQLGAKSVWVVGNKTLGGSVSWVIPMDWLSEMPSYLRGTLTLYTYDAAGTEIGSYAINFTPKVPASAAPTIEAFTVSDDSGALAAVGAYVLGVSRIRAAISGAAGQYGATITAQSTNLGSTSVAGAIGVHTPNTAGTWAVSGKVTDSRGQSTVRSATAQVLDYARPTVTATVERCKSDGTPDPLGTYIKLTSSGSARSLVVNGTEKNTLVRTIRRRKRGTSTWITVQTKSYPGRSWSDTLVFGDGEIAPTEVWEVAVEASDVLTMTARQTSVQTGSVTMSWGRTGVGVGKIYEQGALDVAGDIYQDGKPINKLFGPGMCLVGAAAGTLIKTDLPAEQNVMWQLEIRQNTYAGAAEGTGAAWYQGYSYGAGNAMLNCVGISLMGSWECHAFIHAGALCFWLPYRASAQTSWVSLYTSWHPGVTGNARIVSVTNAAKPTDVSRSAIITPRCVVTSGDSGARLAAGKVTVTSSQVNFAYAVTFPPGRFSVPPHVTVSCSSGAGTLASITTRPIDITATGFTLYVNNLPGTATTADYHWIAVQS